MTNLWLYIFEVSIVFSILYCLYWLLYKNKTFHSINRLVLLLILLSSLTIPTLEFTSKTYLPNNTIEVFELGVFDNFVDNFEDKITQKTSNSTNILSIIKSIYLIGLTFFSIRFLFYLINIIALRYKNISIKRNKTTLIYTKNNLPPFSFFYWVFLPEDEFKNTYNHPIINHENAHAIQWHSFDVLLTEIFSIFLWFVPFVYSFKNSIKSVHEYLADNKTIINNYTKIDYLSLLTKTTEKYALVELSNNFYFSTLKNRITMITKKRSSKISKLQYLVLLPVFALLIQSFSLINPQQKTTEINKNLIDNKPEKSIKIDFIQPIEDSKCIISSTYGMRMHPIKKVKKMHNAIDYKASKGTPVTASANGVVIKQEFIEGGYGNLIAIQHSNNFVTIYAQLSEFKTEIGRKVKQGEIIGLVGSSGMSTGPHLHFEIRKDGEHVNPADYIKK